MIKDIEKRNGFNGLANSSFLYLIGLFAAIGPVILLMHLCFPNLGEIEKGWYSIMSVFFISLLAPALELKVRDLSALAWLAAALGGAGLTGVSYVADCVHAYWGGLGAYFWSAGKASLGFAFTIILAMLSVSCLSSAMRQLYRNRNW